MTWKPIVTAREPPMVPVAEPKLAALFGQLEVFAIDRLGIVQVPCGGFRESVSGSCVDFPEPVA